MFKFIFISMLTLNAWASDPDVCSIRSGAGFKNCLKEFTQTIKSISKIGSSPIPCPPISTGPVKKITITYPPLDKKITSGKGVCEDFIQSDGSYGSWGKEVVSYFDSHDSSLFLKDEFPGMRAGISSCPNWHNMNQDQRKHYWVWVMASIARVESTCNPMARNGKATHGVAVGLMQLNEKPSARKWRGGNCRGAEVLSVRKNLHCSLDIMSELLSAADGRYESNGQLWGKGSASYWKRLREESDGGEIGEFIRLHPFCET